LRRVFFVIAVLPWLFFLLWVTGIPFVARACSAQGTKGGSMKQSADRDVSSLASLVLADSPLAEQELTFDGSFAKLALQYETKPDLALLTQIAASPAVAHIIRHAQNFDYDVPKDSPEKLVAYLLKPANNQAERIETCRQSLAYFTGPMLADPGWVNDTLRYLPADFRFHGTLFLTFGYDIGVAIGPTASLNCTHPHFQGHPRELLYYSIHELHHTAFMQYHPPPRLADLKTCADLLQLVQYSTQLEGMAVWAAYGRRQQEHALQDDADYVALIDGARMTNDEALYFKDYEYLKSRGEATADPAAWAVIERMSSGERLWYRVGARMAQRIEKKSGRAALLVLIEKGPAEFLRAYRAIEQTPAAQKR
jgi:hypothetical protein